MPYGFNRVVNNHPWSRKSHNFTNLFSHVLPVAMRRAFLAGGLLLAIFACRKSLVGVFFQIATLGTQTFITFLLATVESDHQRYCTFLSFYSCHWSRLTSDIISKCNQCDSSKNTQCYITGKSPYLSCLKHG